MINHFSMIQQSPTSYVTELDGKRVSCRSVKIDVGLDRAPTVELELFSEANCEIDGIVLLDDETILRNVKYKMESKEFIEKLFELVKRHNSGG